MTDRGMHDLGYRLPRKSWARRQQQVGLVPAPREGVCGRRSGLVVTYNPT